MGCLAKYCQLYFPEGPKCQCRGELISLPKFWEWHPAGNLDAEICKLHAGQYVSEHERPSKFYLTDRIRIALAEGK